MYAIASEESWAMAEFSLLAKWSLAFSISTRICTVLKLQLNWSRGWAKNMVSCAVSCVGWLRIFSHKMKGLGTFVLTRNDFKPIPSWLPHPKGCHFGIWGDTHTGKIQRYWSSVSQGLRLTSVCSEGFRFFLPPALQHTSDEASC